jgi:DNA-binding MarR family transcriptional regulator
VETNRRTYALTLTPAGRKALRELMAMAREHERDFERLIGAASKAGLIRTLQRIAEGFAEGEQ